MLKSLTGWLTPAVNDESEEPSPAEPAAAGQDGAARSEADKMASSAKDWGSYVLSLSKQASDGLAKAAGSLGTSVLEDQNNIVGDFVKSQREFCQEQRIKSHRKESAVPPWVGYVEEESLRSQILNLSTDKRNFVRNPPEGANFYFDMEAFYPVALATLKEDENLRKMRFELVPKVLKEDVFWRNYFYRVNLIRQSTQLSQLVQKQKNEPAPADDSDSERTHSDGNDDSQTAGSSAAEAVGPDFVSDTTEQKPVADSDELELEKELSDFELISHEQSPANSKDQLDSVDVDEDLGDIEREIEAEMAREDGSR